MPDKVEKPISRLEDWACIQLRRDRTLRSWMGYAHVAATMINLRTAKFSHIA
jgi:hypothetical protein